ncbi:MAG TPA: hypothetical protein VKB30_01730 [Candidatus Limnocylindrales bacterium]|nr:hypothetical protein [Candidatus Limnocylindrales bacterium]
MNARTGCGTSLRDGSRTSFGSTSRTSRPRVRIEQPPAARTFRTQSTSGPYVSAKVYRSPSRKTFSGTR